jgi:hypothetical protein
LAAAIAEAWTCAGSIVGTAFAPHALIRNASIVATIIIGFITGFIFSFLYFGTNGSIAAT